MIHAETVRLVNPHKGRFQKKRRKAGGSAVRRKKSRARNPAELLSLGFTNPQKLGDKKTMAKRKRKAGASRARRSNPFAAHNKTRRKARRANPSGHRRRSSGRRRHNPSVLAGTTSILKSGFYALLGLVAARQVPQMVLGARNAGVIGYAANVAVTVIAAMLGSKFLGKEAGAAMGVGGGVYVANRVIQDNFSPVGRVLSISGIGDYTALGDIQNGYFPLPVPTNGSGQPIIPQELRPLPVVAGKGVGSVASPSRYVSRF
jgi:hypothetical protein